MLNRILSWFRPTPKPELTWENFGHVAHTGQPPAWKRNLHGLDAQARSERSRKAAATKKANKARKAGA